MDLVVARRRNLLEELETELKTGLPEERKRGGEHDIPVDGGLRRYQF